MTFPKRKMLFLLLVVWRVSAVFVVQTYHVPDEYWQSLEVAHKLSFGYGYLTWEWIVGIRSYMYPFLISLLFSLLKFLNLDTATLLIVLPRIFQALLTAYADYRFYVWTGSKVALFLICVNWYWYYCATRTLINSFETCLTIIALSEFPWTRPPGDRGSKFLWIIGFIVFVRPTAIIVWIPLCFGLLYRTKQYLVRYAIIGIFYLIVFTILDTICYGKFVLTPWNFFQINVLDGISEQYGKNHFFWYFTSGLPVVLGLNYGLLALSFHNMCENKIVKSKTLLSAGLWTIAIYSFLAHKEFRFVLPTLPIFIYVVNESYFQQRISTPKKKFLLFLFIISNIFPGYYFSTQHQQGPLKVMNFLRTEIEHRNASEVDILFLTKCHATPYYSHLHKNVSMNFLTCEPNLKNVRNYYDEADYFFDNPAKWVKFNYLNKPPDTWPLYVVTYDTTAPKIIKFIKYYTQLTNYSDTHFPEHGKFNEYVIYRKSVITKDQSLEEVCEALDNLSIQNLELIEEKVLLSIQLENLLRQGHIDLAKARYIRGKESVGMLQVPSQDNDMRSLFDLETCYSKGEEEKDIPNFDISLRKSNKEEEVLQDPIKWFGVLVPQSLKSAQKHFQDALYLTVKIANIQAQLTKLTSHSESLKLLKKVAT